jgi:hypothetical protein
VQELACNGAPREEDGNGERNDYVDPGTERFHVRKTTMQNNL